MRQAHGRNVAAKSVHMRGNTTHVQPLPLGQGQGLPHGGANAAVQHGKLQPHAGSAFLRQRILRPAMLHAGPLCRWRATLPATPTAGPLARFRAVPTPDPQIC